MNRLRLSVFVLVVGVGALSVPRAWAADPALEQAKTLYASASFDEALAAIGRVDAAQSADAEVLFYKTLCLLALGRPQEAGVSARTLVMVNPFFSPDTSDLPPRFQALWAETRKAVIPTLTKELFAGARGRYQGKDFPAALEQFRQVVSLTNDPLWQETPDASDLRTLASGFIELAEAAIPKVAPPPVVAAVPPPPPPPQPVVVEPAVALKQDMPRWVPSDRLLARQRYDGSVRVSIDVDGRVTEVAIVKPTHPTFDTQLLRAARDWVYKPATRNGQPVASEKTVEIHLGGQAQ